MKKIVDILCIVFFLCILLLVMPSAAANVTATISPSTAAQGYKIFINGTAEGEPSSVAIWILGKNFAVKQTEPVNVDGSFSYEIMQDTTMSMLSGQYFVVVQHPGTNGLYDIDWAGAPAEFVYDYGGTTVVSLFRIYGPGSLRGSDAAAALEQGINQPHIDDTYTELQFQIVSSSKIGIYNGGNWYMDYNGDGVFSGIDRYIPYGATGWTQVVGDWNGDGKSEIGIYKDGLWNIDYGGSGVIDANTRYYSFGGAGWTPLVGDWNADKKDEIGVYQNGNWYLDYDGTGVWSFGDRYYGFGTTGWTPVTGKWTSDGYTKIGIYNGGNWYIDYNGDGQFIPATGDKYIPYGASGWTQIVGDWNGDGKSEIGIYNNAVWYLDYDGSGTINTNTKYYSFGGPGWTPITGDWNADTRDEIGVYNAGNWYLDYDGSGVWSAGDRNYGFGTNGWTPVVGKWTPSPILPNIQMIGNVYGLASNPSAGINEIRFTIGLAPGAPAMDLTNMIIVFSTPSTSPIILIQGATASTSVFTTNLSGINPVSSINPSDQIEIVFKVTPVPVNTKVNIEIRPTVGASLAFSKTTPPTISSVNVLY
jgi:hypothetical protein